MKSGGEFGSPPPVRGVLINTDPSPSCPLCSLMRPLLLTAPLCLGPGSGCCTMAGGCSPASISLPYGPGCWPHRGQLSLCSSHHRFSLQAPRCGGFLQVHFSPDIYGAPSRCPQKVGTGLPQFPRAVPRLPDRVSSVHQHHICHQEAPVTSQQVSPGAA